MTTLKIMFFNSKYHKKDRKIRFLTKKYYLIVGISKINSYLCSSKCNNNNIPKHYKQTKKTRLWLT